MLKKEMQFEYAFVKAGGLLMAGADPTGNGGTLAGFADQRNIELLVEAGFTFPEPVRISSADGATFLGEIEHIGTVAAAKQADVVAIDGDPAAPAPPMFVKLSSYSRTESATIRGSSSNPSVGP